MRFPSVLGAGSPGPPLGPCWHSWHYGFPLLTSVPMCRGQMLELICQPRRPPSPSRAVATQHAGLKLLSTRGEEPNLCRARRRRRWL